METRVRLLDGMFTKAIQRVKPQPKEVAIQVVRAGLCSGEAHGSTKQLP